MVNLVYWKPAGDADLRAPHGIETARLVKLPIQEKPGHDVDAANQRQNAPPPGYWIRPGQRTPTRPGFLRHRLTPNFTEQICIRSISVIINSESRQKLHRPVRPQRGCAVSDRGLWRTARAPSSKSERGQKLPGGDPSGRWRVRQRRRLL